MATSNTGPLLTRADLDRLERIWPSNDAMRKVMGQARLALDALEVLREVEYVCDSEGTAWCSMCACRKPGHRPDCKLAAVLAQHPDAADQAEGKGE